VVKELLHRPGRQLRFVFPYFPLAMVHPQAQQAAAARAQGQFWEMHDVLFQHQDALDDSDLLLYAAALGLDRAPFLQELAAHEHALRCARSP
jgi:protein-disulfide isomerase